MEHAQLAFLLGDAGGVEPPVDEAVALLQRAADELLLVDLGHHLLQPRPAVVDRIRLHGLEDAEGHVVEDAAREVPLGRLVVRPVHRGGDHAVHGVVGERLVAFPVRVFLHAQLAVKCAGPLHEHLVAKLPVVTQGPPPIPQELVVRDVHLGATLALVGGLAEGHAKDREAAVQRREIEGRELVELPLQSVEHSIDLLVDVPLEDVRQPLGAVHPLPVPVVARAHVRELLQEGCGRVPRGRPHGDGRGRLLAAEAVLHVARVEPLHAPLEDDAALLGEGLEPVQRQLGGDLLRPRGEDVARGRLGHGQLRGRDLLCGELEDHEDELLAEAYPGGLPCQLGVPVAREAVPRLVVLVEHSVVGLGRRCPRPHGQRLLVLGDLLVRLPHARLAKAVGVEVCRDLGRVLREDVGRARGQLGRVQVNLQETLEPLLGDEALQHSLPRAGPERRDLRLHGLQQLHHLEVVLRLPREGVQVDVVDVRAQRVHLQVDQVDGVLLPGRLGRRGRHPPPAHPGAAGPLELHGHLVQQLLLLSVCAGRRRGRTPRGRGRGVLGRCCPRGAEDAAQALLDMVVAPRLLADALQPQVLPGDRAVEVMIPEGQEPVQDAGVLLVPGHEAHVGFHLPRQGGRPRREVRLPVAAARDRVLEDLRRVAQQGLLDAFHDLVPRLLRPVADAKHEVGYLAGVVHGEDFHRVLDVALDQVHQPRLEVAEQRADALLAAQVQLGHELDHDVDSVDLTPHALADAANRVVLPGLRDARHRHEGEHARELVQQPVPRPEAG
mmetsp:Transcript_87147/g.247083  ORF Transcript_87147/g.247083 Transcript_87147/m.247083 type:complete len:778 (+) Transcript_87147:197-2530(+)